MKKIIIIIALILPVIYYGCKSDTAVNPIDNINFTLTTKMYLGLPTIFFQPSENAKLSQIQFKSTSTPLPTDTAWIFPVYEFSKDTAYALTQQSSWVVSGYKWTFVFIGNKASNNEVIQKYVDYIVP